MAMIINKDTKFLDVFKAGHELIVLHGRIVNVGNNATALDNPEITITCPSPDKGNTDWALDKLINGTEVKVLLYIEFKGKDS